MTRTASSVKAKAAIPEPSSAHAPLLAIRDCGPKGRGVIALSPIMKGEVFESAPVIVVPGEQSGVLRQTTLSSYYYEWGEDAAIALGYGSVYNHSYRPSARFYLNPTELRIEFVALRNIQPGEEITINYNGEPDDLDPVWFTPHEDDTVLE